MKSLMLVTLTVIGLGISVAAVAQGVPDGFRPQHYGRAWAATQQAK